MIFEKCNLENKNKKDLMFLLFCEKYKKKLENIATTTKNEQ